MVRRKSLTRRLPCGSRRAAGDGLRSGPGDPDPNGDPDGSHRRVHPDRRTAGSHSVSCASYHRLVGAMVRHPDEACEPAVPQTHRSAWFAAWRRNAVPLNPQQNSHHQPSRRRTMASRISRVSAMAGTAATGCCAQNSSINRTAPSGLNWYSVSQLPPCKLS